MRNSDQPQNTKQNLVRDASVQISEEDQAVILKSTLIRYGAPKRVQERHPEWDKLTAQPFAVYDLCAILADLTSSNKENRDWAKQQVRELVKLGKEAGNESQA